MMNDNSFLQLYTASLDNLIDPVDQELEDQFLSAQSAVSKVQKLHRDIQWIIGDLNSVASRYPMKNVLIAEGDPLYRAIQDLNASIDVYYNMKGSGTLSISDVSEVCFSSKNILNIQNKLDAAREQTQAVANFCSEVFKRMVSQLSDAKARLLSAEAFTTQTVFDQCQTDLKTLTSQIDGSVGSMNLSEAFSLLRSSAMQDLSSLFVKLERECKTAEEDKAKRVEAARQAELERVRLEREKELQLRQAKEEHKRKEREAQEAIRRAEEEKYRALLARDAREREAREAIRRTEEEKLLKEHKRKEREAQEAIRRAEEEKYRALLERPARLARDAREREAQEAIRRAEEEKLRKEQSTGMPPRVGVDGVLNRGKRKTPAGILALYLGGAGVHKFYLGNWGIGIVYLVSCFFIPGVSSVIGVIEAIRIFSLSDVAFNEKYNYRNLKPFEVMW